MKRQTLTLILLALSALTAQSGALQQEWLMYGRDTSRNAYTTAGSHYSLNYTGVLWAYPTGSWVQSPPVAGDVDNDGYLEIAVGSDNGNLYMLNRTGGLVWNYTTGGRIRTSPAIGNLDLDQKLEVVAASEDNRIYAFDCLGNLLWSRKSRYPITTSPSIVEVSYNNRGSEVVYAAGDVIYVLNGKGEEIQTYGSTEDISQNIAIADINNDGSMEFMLASSDGTINVLSRFFTPIKKFVLEGERISPPIAVDMNGDRIKDAVFASLSGGAYHVYHTTYSGANSCYTGTCLAKSVQYLRLYPQWKSSSTAMLMPPLAIADLDDDGRLDIVMKTSDNSISAFNGSGFNAMTYSVNGVIKQNPALADLDGDSKTEIIFGADDGNLYMLNYPEGGRLILHINGSIRSMPALADLNRDGKLEVIFGADDGSVYAIGDIYLQTQRRANKSLIDAKKAISSGDKKSALEYISTALGLYIWLKDREGISTANEMMAGINSSRNADIYLENANTAYRTYDLRQAEELCNVSLQLYANSGSMEGQMKAADLLKLIRVHVDAEDDYKKGIGLYNSEGVSRNALELLNKARAGYVAVGYEPGVTRTEAVLKRLTADEYLQNASSYQSSGDYLHAKEYAEKAMALYSELNYEEGMNSSVSMIASSLRASSAGNAGYSNSIYAVGILVIAVLLAAIFFAYRRARNTARGRQQTPAPTVEAGYSPPWFEVKDASSKNQPDYASGKTSVADYASGKTSVDYVKTSFETLPPRPGANAQDYAPKKTIPAGEPKAKENFAVTVKEKEGPETDGMDERILSMEARLKFLENQIKSRASPKDAKKDDLEKK
jgi:hypothetical protein